MQIRALEDELCMSDTTPDREYNLSGDNIWVTTGYSHSEILLHKKVYVRLVKSVSHYTDTRCRLISSARWIPNEPRLRREYRTGSIEHARSGIFFYFTLKTITDSCQFGERSYKHTRHHSNVNQSQKRWLARDLVAPWSLRVNDLWIIHVNDVWTRHPVSSHLIRKYTQVHRCRLDERIWPESLVLLYCQRIALCLSKRKWGARASGHGHIRVFMS